MRSATKRKTGKDKLYLAWLHTLPCAVVDDILPGGSPCEGRIIAHHSGDHGFSQKADDRTAIPLCEGHHTEGPHAIHRLSKNFWSFHGLDRDALIADLNARYESERAA